jgi:hypothetical protein
MRTLLRDAIRLQTDKHRSYAFTSVVTKETAIRHGVNQLATRSRSGRPRDVQECVKHISISQHQSSTSCHCDSVSSNRVRQKERQCACFRFRCSVRCQVVRSLITFNWFIKTRLRWCFIATGGVRTWQQPRVNVCPVLHTAVHKSPTPCRSPAFSQRQPKKLSLVMPGEQSGA